MPDPSLVPISSLAKRSPVGSFVVGAFVGALVGAALAVAVMTTSGDALPVAEPLAAHQAPPEEVSAVEPDSDDPESASASTSTIATPDPPSRTSAPILERGARGDEDALNLLEAKDLEHRTSEETLALAMGKGARRLKEIEQLEKKLNVVPRFGREPEALKQIRELASSAQVGIPTLKMLANLKHDVGTDLLFTLWTRSAVPESTSELAGQLLYSTDVRARASEAMKVILDLRSVKNCEKILEVMDRVKVHSDTRALLSLQPFYSHKGCGLSKESDCWPCLRKTNLLDEATVAARTRAPP